MEFPNKPWAEKLDIPIPHWATYEIGFTSVNGDSYLLWYGPGMYQYFATTDGLMLDKEGVKDLWNLQDWEDGLSECPFTRFTDLQPIVENE